MAFPTQQSLSTQLAISNRQLEQHCNDDAFGPWSDCRLDFTIFFENTVLSMLPSIGFLLAFLIRIRALYGQDEKVLSNNGRVLKMVGNSYFQAWQDTGLDWILKPSDHFYFVGSDTSSFANLVFSGALFGFECISARMCSESSCRHWCDFHVVSRASTFSKAIYTTVQLLDYHTAARHTSASINVSLSMKFLLLVLESQSKKAILKPKYRKLSPESTSGILNRSFMWWLNGLFLQDSKRLLTESMLYDLDEDLATQASGDRLQKAWDTCSQFEGQLCFVSAVWRCFRGPYGYVVLPRLCLIALTFMQPSLIAQVINIITNEDTARSREIGCLLIFATVLIYVGISVAELHASHNLYRCITMFRSAAITLIYSRSLSLEDRLDDTNGAVTLMSTDVDTIAFCFENLNDCWSRLIEIIVGITLLTRHLGWVSIVPLIIVTFSTMGASWVTKVLGSTRRIWVEATQRRVSITTAMLNEMKSLKMMGLTDVIGETVQNQRVQETKQMEEFAWVIVWKNTIANIPFVMAPAATFAVYAVQAYFSEADFLNTTQAFTSLALITLVSNPAAGLLQAVPNVAGSIGCFQRIQKYLLENTKEDYLVALESTTIHLLDTDNNYHPVEVPLLLSPHTDPNFILVAKNITLRPSKISDIVLRDLSLSIHEGTVTAITGPVGTGKSTVLKALLGELPPVHGYVYTRTNSVAYCSQIPWLPNTTIRLAIIGPKSQLVADAIDEKWYETVLDICALRYDISKLRDGDQTKVGSNGIALSGGQKMRVALARALFARSNLLILDDVFSALDQKTQKWVFERLLGNASLVKKAGTTIVLATHSARCLSMADQVIIIGPSGTFKRGTYNELIEDGYLSGGDQEGETDSDVEEESPPEALSEEKMAKIGTDERARDLTRKTGDIEVYSYYFKSVGALPMISFVGFVVFHVLSGSFSQIWLKWWSDIESHQMLLYISVYFLLSFCYSFGNGGYVWAICVWIGPSTGRKLHKVLLDSVLRAPMSFFTKTETGILVNKFSNDMTLIESQLAFGVLATISNLVASLAEAALVATGSSHMALTIPFLLLTLYNLQKRYLQISRQLRFLDLEMRSPIYSHFLETLSGLSTIRAFGWEQESKAVNIKVVKNSQKPYYLLFCIQRWLELVLNLIVAAMAVIVVALAMNLRASTSPGLLGISLNNILSFNSTLSMFVNGWTVLETSLGAIARLKNFEATTPVEETGREDIIPDDNWPSKGRIEFKDVSASYNALEPVLEDISITILPGEKVGISGRTGSGKSTLLSLILRILPVSSGSILIDNTDISRVPLHILRTRLITLPQDVPKFPGTIRHNLYPYLPTHVSDGSIISVLQMVHLWPIIKEREGGLNADLSSDSLSKGQWQLLALARAVLQKKHMGIGNAGKVLLMDEVMSGLDEATERVMNEVVQKVFKDSTVLIVSHSREGLKDMNTVLKMDAGKIVEMER
ncbi:hypothetical protein BP5796_05617 [Coleophoma crateriformis]|uniref:Uncharacterized protein n=1 Tax=Coleophoma crateriformis TaxID=565419 RepID=A0A3D8S3Q0_9HELO|nr:hypothetical protein BP5796_05617 [Coleophoma crateriformis]